jgi:hypothetical protein
MVPSSLFLVWHFQQQVTPNYASYRYTMPFAIATNTLICEKLKPNPKPNTPCPCLPECVGVSGRSHRCTLHANNPSIIPSACLTEYEHRPRFYGLPEAKSDRALTKKEVETCYQYTTKFSGLTQLAQVGQVEIPYDSVANFNSSESRAPWVVLSYSQKPSCSCAR